MNPTFGSSRGTVAARVQAFQDVQHLEDRSPQFTGLSRAISRAKEAGVTVGRGRREYPSFGSPAGRTSRDGTEGFRCNGRPPVGSFELKAPPSTKETELCQRPKLPVSVRPATSTADEPSQSVFTATHDEELGRKAVRGRCSMENVTDEGCEISGARSRLRSVIRGKSPRPTELRGQPGRAYTITELGNMIDDAIEEQVGEVSTIHTSEASRELSPEPPAVRRWSSVRAARKSTEEVEGTYRQACSRSRIRRPSVDLSEQLITNDITRPGEAKISSSKDAVSRQISHPQVGHEDEASILPRSPVRIQNCSFSIGKDDRGLTQPQVGRPAPKVVTPKSCHKFEHPHQASYASHSPVKQRTALFEKLQRKACLGEHECEAPHDQHIHVKTEWTVVPEHLLEPNVEKELHNLRFGKTIHTRPDNDLIPLALPQLVDSRRRLSKMSDSSSGSAYETARQSSDANHPAEASPAPGASIPQHEILRKASMNWPFKWSLFNKGNSAPPQETEDVVNAIAKDKNRSSARPSVIKSRVQDLLAAATKQHHEEEARRRSEATQTGRRRTRDSAHVFENESERHSVGWSSLKPTEISPLQVPIKEQAESFAKMIETTNEDAELEHENQQSRSLDGKELKTPVRDLITEKEVLPSPTGSSSVETFRVGSPLKTASSTPIRGRTVNTKPPMSPGGSQYAMEQRFTLSPGPSRSQSRATRSRMKVEVEVRESPEREARDRGEKIMIVRANVEAVDGSEERED